MRCTSWCLATALLSTACASTRAPKEFLLSAKESESNALGSWISVVTRPGMGARIANAAGQEIVPPPNGHLLFEGELLAALPDRLYLRLQHIEATDWNGPFRAFAPRPVRIDAADIESARVEQYATASYGLAGWTVAGTLSTISHGFVLVVSAPLWIISGSISSAVESRGAFLDLKAGDSLQALAPWARFPQGLVPGLDEGTVGVAGPSP